jgi:DNA-binding transcriptional LysR family regulator
MHSRDRRDLSIRDLRAFLAVVQHGSLTKAARELNLTQPAISMQLKRLQGVIGGALFVKTSARQSLSELGLRLEQYARRIVTLHDQAIAAAGRNPNIRTICAGVQGAFARVVLPDLLSLSQSSDTTNWEFRSNSAQVLMEQYKAGYLDLVVMMAPPDGLPNVAAEWTEQLVWVCRRRRSPLATGKPIPFIGSNTSFVDRSAHNALSQFNVPYRITVQAGDMGIAIRAAEAGLGVLAMTERCVPPSLVITRDPPLPRLPRVRVAVFYHEGFDVVRYKSELDTFISIARPSTKSQVETRP